MNARLISWLVAGGIVFVCGQAVLLNGSAPAPESAKKWYPSVAAANLESSYDSARVSIHVPGFTGKPSIQVLDSPDSLVVDLRGVNRGKVPKADILGLDQSSLIMKARLAQYQPEPKPVTRLVLELAPGVKAVVSTEPHGVDISLKNGIGKIQATLLEKDFSLPARPSSGHALLAANALDLGSYVSNYSAKPQAGAAPDYAANDEWVQHGGIDRMPQIGSPYIGLPTLGSMPVVPIAAANVASAASYASSAPPMAPIQQQAARPYSSDFAAKRFIGKPITVDLPNADLRTVLDILASHSGLSLVMDPDVNATGLTIKFTDVPWDEILHNVVINTGVSMDITENVLRIAKVGTLQKEAEDRKRMEDARSSAGEFITLVRGLSFAKVDEVKKLLEDGVKSQNGKIHVDPRTNQIIINDLPHYVERMGQLIDKLDIKIPLVQIEARIVEANKGWEKAFGTYWPTSNSGGTNLTENGQSLPWGTQNGHSWNSVNNRADAGRNQVTGSFSPGKADATGIVGAAGEVWVSFLSNRMSLNAIIQALESQNQIKVVSEPKLTVPSNKEGYIGDGARIPYQSAQGGVAGGAITVEFTDAELSLRVTPQITNDGIIQMEVHVEKGEPDFSQQVQGTPTILRKKIDTTVFCRDGGTAILGGVFTNSVQTGTTGVPLLSKLPGIGWMFRNKTSNDKQTEMLVLISPKILDY